MVLHASRLYTGCAGRVCLPAEASRAGYAEPVTPTWVTYWNPRICGSQAPGACVSPKCPELLGALKVIYCDTHQNLLISYQLCTCSAGPRGSRLGPPFPTASISLTDFPRQQQKGKNAEAPSPVSHIYMVHVPVPQATAAPRSHGKCDNTENSQ